MNNYSISIKHTNNPSILKFEANKFLTQHDNFEFKNIEDAEKSPLAQQLFHLPFVKTVYIAQNFVAIEKYNIVEWGDIQTELSEQISNYLNSGKPIVISSEQAENKLVPVTVYAESTPNPTVMKFVTNKKLVVKITEFKNIDEAKNAPLPLKLFHFPFIKEVFIDENYISIKKYDLVEWEEITMEVREFIRNYIQEGGIVLNDDYVDRTHKENTEKVDTWHPEKIYDDTSLQIIDILEEYVKPAVASDGGNIMFESYNEENQTVKVVLQGACSGCPSSTFTLKNGIENMLKEMMPEKVAKVEAING